jgi:hypothetical protein
MFKLTNMIPDVRTHLKKLFDLLERGPALTGFMLVFAAALAVRLVFVLVWVWRYPVWFYGAEMGNVAVNLYEGRGFSSPFSLGSKPTSVVAPLVPLLWAGIMHLTGGPTNDTALAIIVLQAVASSFTAAFYWLIARRVTFRLHRVRTGTLSVLAILFVAWPETLFRLTDTWYFVFQELGLVVLVYCAMAWWDRPGLREGLLMGAVAGVVALVNPTPVPIYAIALIAPLVVRRDKRLTVARHILASGLVASFIVAPWIIRDYSVFGRFVPIRSNFGLELRQGNNPVESIRQNANSVHPMLRPEEFDRYETMGEVAYMQWSLDQAVEYMASNPGVTVVRILKRMYVYWTTDVTDHWSTFRDLKWWNRDWRFRLLKGLTVLSALVPLVIVFIGIFLGRLQGLAYRFLFIGLFILLPLPYYITWAGDVYSAAIRPWLAMLAAIVVLRQSRVAVEGYAGQEGSSLAAV